MLGEAIVQKTASEEKKKKWAGRGGKGFQEV